MTDRKRFLLLIIVWIWFFLGVPITAMLIAYIKGIALTVNSIVNMFMREPYLASYLELVCAGGLPLAITLASKERFAIYGLRKKGLVKSVLLSLIVVAIKLIPRILSGDYKFVSFNLPFPINLWYAFLGVFAYGPLEVFFVIWLITNTDYVLKSLEKKFSPGLVITVLIFGLSHIIFARGGILNAIDVTIVFFVLGLIYRCTGNSVGPMIAWTLINRFVFYLVVGCLT